MAYTNAIFYLDYENGSDAARTALTGCIASNPSGSITRINKTAHGLVTGAVVDLTLFSTWLNSAWKITKVDDDNFDLDDAVWQTTADADGTVTPRGGSSWADAWKTPSLGITTGRVQVEDTVRVAKTAEPVSLGQTASFTNASTTVTLTSAVTKTIQNADVLGQWTASTNITLTSSSNRKVGGGAMTVTPASAFTTGKVAYAAVAGGGTQDFSSYQKICFWMRTTSSTSIAADIYKICLCSDTTGDTIVNEINIPALSVTTSTWRNFTLDYGASLGASIQSVAIYANSDPGTTAFSINNIFATNDLTLSHLIGKDGDVNYTIRSIDGTNLQIDSNNTSVSGQGYYGTTESATLYYQLPTMRTTAGDWSFTWLLSGTHGRFHLIGGWNTSNTTRDGYTVLGQNFGIAADFGAGNLSYWDFSYFKFARIGPFSSLASARGFKISNCFVFGSVGISNSSSNSFNNVILENCTFMNNSAIVTTYSWLFLNCNFYSNSLQPVAAYSTTFVNCVFANNAFSSFYVTENSIIRNCLFNDPSVIGSSAGSTAWVYDYNQTAGDYRGFAASTSAPTIKWQTSIKQGSDPGAWEIFNDLITQVSVDPIVLKVATVACSANNQVTAKVWIKKSHATQAQASFYLPPDYLTLSGITETTVTKADDTNWEQLTITFTPTESGIVPLYVKSWRISDSYTYVGSVEITQA